MESIDIARLAPETKCPSCGDVADGYGRQIGWSIADDPVVAFVWPCLCEVTRSQFSEGLAQRTAVPHVIEFVQV